MPSRRVFIKSSAKTASGLYLGALAFSPKSYRRIRGANDRVLVGVIGFSDRFQSSLLPCFLHHYKEMNFDIVAVSDIWNRRREDGKTLLKEKFEHDIQACPNNDELYRIKDLNAVIISTAD